MYYYRAEMTTDIIDYLKGTYTSEELREKLSDREAFEEELNDDLWACDLVTGNASGSYFCNTYAAEEALCHNWDLLRESLDEFCCDDVNPIEKGAEWCDVTIRCYLLREVISSVLCTLSWLVEQKEV